MLPQSSVLLRRHLCKRLSEYFSQPSNDVIGSIDYGFISRIPFGLQSRDAVQMTLHQTNNDTTAMNTINFSSLLGEWHWKRTYKRVYQEQRGMWLTPCEIFRPYYSNILANFISNSMKASLQNTNDETFEIVELGGGRGTNANTILNYMKDKNQDMYERLDRYYIFDSSPTLHELQREVLISGENGPRTHAEKIKLVNVDLMDIAEGSSPFLNHSNIPTAVIALELLDNLPHDKIARCMQSHELLQAEIVSSEDSVCDNSKRPQSRNLESFQPLNDTLLLDILSIAPELYTPTVSQGPRWIPTVALGILMKLYECRPNASIGLADFDWLPYPNITDFLEPALAEPSIGDPLVTDMNGKDHACYLSSPPGVLCDILFPTDFQRLTSFMKRLHTTNKSIGNDFSVSSIKQHEFLLKHGMQEVEQTKSWLTGYSPLIDDFGNCSVLEVTPLSPSNKSS